MDTATLPAIAPKCPICKTDRYLTTTTIHECAGCGYAWDLDGSPRTPVTRGYRCPRMPVGNAHDHGDGKGNKPGTLTAVWVARHLLRTARP